jgi:hypothetical protein
MIVRIVMLLSSRPRARPPHRVPTTTLDDDH